MYPVVGTKSDAFGHHNPDHSRLKRKAPLDVHDKHRKLILALIHHIEQGLKTSVADDTIHRCGDAPLAILGTSPDEVLELAHSKLHAWPFRSVPACWPRLYEDASLYKVVHFLRRLEEREVDGLGSHKKVKLGETDCPVDILTEVVTTLDMGYALSGAPARRTLFASTFELLAGLITDDVTAHSLSYFRITAPPNLQTDSAIPYRRQGLEFEQFQYHLDKHTTPLCMTGAIDSWPATDRWKDPSYLLQLTLGGRRLVPVEIGRSYTDDDWAQKMMSFGEYMHRYVLPEHPSEVGYLAQHDLLSQIPALGNDIQTPDYCYTSPPDNTASGSKAIQLDEPMVHVWFGPKSTRTPIHTDPYHNIFCQVVGHKYVRVYPPEEVDRLYPKGIDESGVDMANTSTVDFAFAKRIDHHALDSHFPNFGAAKYQEIILNPGDCLYVPAGWWHFVESLSTSFSVSFWWN